MTQRGSKLVRNVYLASSIDPARLGCVGFDGRALLEALPKDALMVKTKHSGDYFYNFIVFHQSHSVSEMYEPLILGLCGYALPDSAVIGCLDHWQVACLECGLRFPVETLGLVRKPELKLEEPVESEADQTSADFPGGGPA